MPKNPRLYPHWLIAPPASSDSTIGPRRSYHAIKRGFDIVFTLMIAPFALALVAVLVLLIRLDGENAFFRQPRLGKGGRVFHLWKLRTMVPDAERRLQEYLDANPLARLEWDRTQKLQNDPRVTTLGKYLRKYSADELPQLLNVLLGDMSLVGPRPMLPDQRSHYPGSAYFSLRPGLTGLWQISERNMSSFAQRATYDTRYAGIMSFGTDLSILSRTIFVVLRGTGF
ncbi:sugar transferase [Sinorhizobium mexicanum]|uniref:Sugar transferase n=1 Tax=Sinorhizobium mexicanum TaxID=375549 RepID=A0A859QR00_9HYPH|nr:sugar transferase [Sinorhizobium mexicanum]MBP1887300.1 lipopolysaccharide/colanic/teichoic acid biosynthesis glycosyltransferase [Sinorhizobium mexicanum]QLL65815.1 sugar transferase [Sinorhizobium mexicanum]